MLQQAVTSLGSAQILQRFASKIVGIDLGTTHCCVAHNGEVLRDQGGFASMPSVVHFPEGSATPLVGRAAEQQSIDRPEATVSVTKRLIGRRYNDPLVEQLRKMVPYSIVPAPNGDAWVGVRGTQYSPSQIGGFLLAQVKQTAERALGEPITEAVITCPAYFVRLGLFALRVLPPSLGGPRSPANDAQRQSTKDAGTLAGLKVRRLVNEPTAACLAYGIGKQGNKVTDGIFKVRATNGDTFLGGEDFDAALVRHLLEEIRTKHHKDLSAVPRAMKKLREVAEEAKKQLSTDKTAQVDVSVFVPGETAASDPVPFRFQTELTRERLEQLTRPLVQRTLAPCQKCLKDAGLKPAQLHEVVLIGGMTRMPAVVQSVRQFFGREPFAGMNPEWAVAQGASIQASILAKGSGGSAGGDMSKVVLMDVTPLSLGIEVYGGAFSRVVPRNTSIPASISQEFTNVRDYASTIEVKIYQGEREMAADNALLGNLELMIEPKRKGESRITVKFDIDANGILHVAARDAASGQEQKVQINARGGLSEDQIKQMLTDASANAANDRHKLVRCLPIRHGGAVGPHHDKRVASPPDWLPQELAHLLVRAEEKLAVLGTGLTLGGKAVAEDVRKEVASAMQEVRAAMTVRSVLSKLPSSNNPKIQCASRVAPASGGKSQGNSLCARIHSLILLVLGTIVTFVLMVYSEKFKNWPFGTDYGICVTDSGAADIACLAKALACKLCFGMGIFFLIMFLLSLGAIKKTGGPWVAIQTGGWAFKGIIFFILMVASYFLPPQFAQVFIWIAQFGGGFFLLAQVIVLIDWMHQWNKSWVEKEWLAGLIAASVVLGLLWLGQVIAMYVVWSKCGVNVALTTVSTVLCLLLLLAALKLPRGSLLEVSLTTAYCAYLCLSSYLSQPTEWSCMNYVDSATTNSIWATIISFIITLASLGYTSFSTASTFAEVEGHTAAESTKTVVPSAADYKKVEEGQAGVSSAPAPAPAQMSAEDAEPEVDPQAEYYGYWKFHLVMFLACLYVCVLLTGWTLSDKSTTLTSVGSGTVSMWIKQGTQWCVMILYFWTLVAPYACPNREFD
ncbi:heat shock protein 70 [Paratrimastix pyriformis]|uniref:Heat shock protein 70 n=1 Tax=Paratrimastix pyriformis TaxID=342808 RepID=A0ABQ8URM6_9EUKA|nr:heat shock protein 70 [Paratrimastix pyriformis]